MRARACAVVVALLVQGLAGSASSQTAPSAGECAKADFEAVVNAAGAARSTRMA